MKLEKVERGDGDVYYRVRVDADEVVVASGKTVPYPTWIGVVDRSGIKLWRPAGYLPRGYDAAAMKMLKEAQKQLANSAPS